MATLKNALTTRRPYGAIMSYYDFLWVVWSKRFYHYRLLAIVTGNT